MKTTPPAYSTNTCAYDQRLGQFPSADIMVQNPENQNYNRYAYYLNNPLKYTDPSGYLASNGNNNYLNDNDPSKIFASFETSDFRIWGWQTILHDLESFIRKYWRRYSHLGYVNGLLYDVYSLKK